MGKTFGIVSLTSSSRCQLVLGQCCKACNVCARPRQACDKSTAHRIKDIGHDEGDRMGRLLGSASYTIATRRDDDIHIEAHQFGRQRGEAIKFSVSISILDDNIFFPLRTRGSRNPCRNPSVRVDIA
jgi:hypothetical protein